MDATGRFSFSRVQSLVALVAGLTSIGGAAYSTAGFFRTGDASGEIVAVVRDAATEAPVRGTVVEVLTRENGLVTTVLQSDDGLARRAIAAGVYHVRVVHPDYAEVRRDVEVVPEGVAEIHVMLERRGRRGNAARGESPGARPGGAARAAPSPGQVVDRSVAVTRRILGRIGF